MRIKVFNIGDRVKLSDELLNCSPNKHWIGKRGTVINDLKGSYVLVKWDHLEKPMQQPTEYIDLAYSDTGGFERENNYLYNYL